MYQEFTNFVGDLVCVRLDSIAAIEQQTSPQFRAHAELNGRGRVLCRGSHEPLFFPWEGVDDLLLALHALNISTVEIPSLGGRREWGCVVPRNVPAIQMHLTDVWSGVPSLLRIHTGERQKDGVASSPLVVQRYGTRKEVRQAYEELKIRLTLSLHAEAAAQEGA